MKLPTFEQIRTVVLLGVGIFIVLWETIVNEGARPAILVTGIMFCGFPVVLSLDKILKGAAFSIAVPQPPAVPPSVPTSVPIPISPPPDPTPSSPIKEKAP